MTTRQPDNGGRPDEPEGPPTVPDEVWFRFLTDSESAIRATAPKEPSAQERAPRWHPEHPTAETGKGPQSGKRRSHQETGAIGELWQPEDSQAGPAWRDLDGFAKLRRAGRVIVTAAAITLILGAWSRLSTSAGGPSGQLDDTVQQVEQAPPATTPFLPVSTSTASPSSASYAG